jgi:hypothetical protein
MKVIDCDQLYNSEFPELFKWHMIDSLKLTSVSIKISDLIKEDLKTIDRNLIPGLRTALNVIAEITDIYI